MIKKTTHLILFGLFSLYLPSYAADNFNVIINTENQTINDGFNTFEEIFDAIEQNRFNQITGYTNQSAATVNINLRGIDALVKYDQNSSILNFSIPSIVDKTFNEGTRTLNENALEDFLKKNQDGTLTKILQKAAAETATDPVAGNPDSLMSTMALADFNAAHDMATFNTKREKQVNAAGKSDNNKLEIGLEAGRSSANNGVEKNLLTLPLSYTHYFDDPRKQLKISSPLSYVETNNSKSYKGSLGAALSYPINGQWTLIPAARVGVLGSKDLGTATAIYSGSLTSLYHFSYKNMNVMVGNMLSIIQTADLKIEDYELSYQLSNQILKNGISVERPMNYKVLGKKASSEFSISNTQFFGDNLHIENHTDLALSIGTRKRVGGASATADSMHVGITYTIGEHGYNGGKLNFGYKF